MPVWLGSGLSGWVCWSWKARVICSCYLTSPMVECILYVDKTAHAVTIRVGIQALFIPSVQLHSSIHRRCFKLIHGAEFGVVSRETVEFKSGEP